MPEEERGLVGEGEVCIADVGGVEDHASLMIRDEAVGGSIGCQVVTTLVVLEEVQVACQGLKATAYATL